MKRTLWAALAAGLAWTAATMPGQAQTQQYAAPTTRILAIGTITPGTSLASVRAILPTEVRETVKLYLAGKIEQWFSLADRNGVVFLLNAKDPKEAHAMLEALPLGQAHLMQFELLPLAPLAPLRQLPGVTDGSP
ncbi:hypothetical protein OZ411_31535 [Bradyrhizobium sp. Arg237L]|uniref:hypothetical protein n=1 Tax=Bradyrhizobium sp. Arg237L TaxID=3003352 RepID=UPI00249F0D94|nr:hypothetical protein [Bradyrhizobium sp. Arg237L]MDI4237348.1 hypothetical protein [Bradyrhizobium sp. Arg237L]